MKAYLQGGQADGQILELQDDCPGVAFEWYKKNTPVVCCTLQYKNSGRIENGLHIFEYFSGGECNPTY